MRVYDFGGSGRNLTKFYQRDVAHRRGDQVDNNFTRGADYKIWHGKKRPNLARFLTTFQFDRKYLMNG